MSIAAAAHAADAAAASHLARLERNVAKVIPQPEQVRLILHIII
jgi:hypothetical protein